MLSAAQSALLYRATGAVKPPLVFEATTTTYSTTQIQHQAGIQQIYCARLYWENGRTHFVFQDITTTGGRHFILTYNENYGIGRPIGYGRTSTEGHHRPVIIKHNNKLYIVSERDHNSVPLTIWSSRAADDAMLFTEEINAIGSVPTYPCLYEKNGIFTILCQSNDTRAMYTKNTSGDFSGTWTTEEEISSRQADEDEHYVAAPTNGDILPNEIVFLIGGRNDDPATPVWFNKYIIRAEVTASGITYRNWTRTFSKTSQISAAEMTTHFLYYSTGLDTAQGYIPVTAIDKVGNFYDVTGDGSGGYDFVYLLNGQSSATVKAISLPGSPTIMDAVAIGLDAQSGQNGGCPHLLAVSQDLVYAFFRINEGGLGKIYMYQTVDLGDNWTFVQDVFDDVSADIYGFTLPFNSLNIPNGRNFICAATGDASPNTNLYMKRVAWGSLQSDTGNMYDDFTAYSAAEYDALMLRSYYVETGKITNTGTTLNSLIDQSASVQDATAVASPVLDSSTTPTFVTFNGTNNAMTIPVTGLTALTEGTIIVVAKPVSSVNVNFVTVSRAGFTSPYQVYGKSSTEITRIFDGVSGMEARGSTTITNDFHIFVFQMSNIQNHVLQFLDGELQFRTETTPDITEGRFTAGLSPAITRVQIANLIRTSTNWYAFDLKHCAITGTPLNQEQLGRSLKYLANKYSITLVDHHN